MNTVKTVLIIEDNAMNRRLIRDVVSDAGYDVIEAVDADEGIAIARSTRPDLILMDVQLPGTNGLTATRILKNDLVTRTIPIVALTAYAMKGDSDRILAAGCDGYLAKPVRYRQVHDVLSSFLGAVCDKLAVAPTTS